jgi:pimeloyl-ACP methyl ester carboxylesterase
VGTWEFGEAEAKRITQPVLYVLGGKSQPLFAELANVLKSWIPQTELVTMPESNHALQMTDPKTAAEGIADFLRRHPL